jgi:hypothetical protein
MRIGTWNLEGRWTATHVDVMTQLDCDVWLLTEINRDTALPGYHSLVATVPMTNTTHWSGILSRRPATGVGDPHPASCAGEIGDLLACSSVLPWPLAREHWPWGPAEHQARFDDTLHDLRSFLEGRDVIWGGDWNQPLTGRLSGFTRAAQASLSEALNAMGLQVPTATLPGRNAAQASIDHIAIPATWHVPEAGSVQVTAALSDHNVYFVETEPS